jgi:hypothetical protein
MKSRNIVLFGWFYVFAGLLACFIGFNLPKAAQAAGTVTNCATFGTVGTVGTLADSLNNGGTVTFQCAGTIIVPEIAITQSTTLNGNGFNVTLSGNNSNRLFVVDSGQTLAINGLTIANAFATGTGGAIQNNGGVVTVNNSIFNNNTATNLGGGIINNGGNVSISTSTFNGNVAQGGGGVYNTGTLSISNSTFSNNRANGVFGGGAIYNTATIDIGLSTFSGNVAAADGGAIAQVDGAATIGFVTIAGNQATGGNGGGVYRNGGSVTVSSSIIGDNVGALHPDFSGVLNSNGYNLVGNINGTVFSGDTTGNVTGVAANLNALANNGGTTQTRLPALGSPAINAGNPNNGVCSLVDQRGQSRPQGGRCDIGAVEVVIGAASGITAFAGTPQSTIVNTPFATNLAARTTDSAGYPVSNVVVTFTVNFAGLVGANFPGPSPAISATTDANGVATAPVLTANQRPGSYTATANRSTAPFATPATFNLTNLPGGAVSLQVSGYPSPTTAGATGTFSVVALDAFGNVSTGYTGTVTFSSSDTQATLPVNAPLTAGVGTFSAIFRTVGTQSLTATDTVSPTITGTQTGIIVNPGPPLTLTVSGYPSPVIAGTTNNFTVTARDAFGNPATGYTGTVTFDSDDTLATLPTATALISGTGTFSATLRTAGIRRITATDNVSPTVTGSQLNIIVNPAAPASIVAISGTPQSTLINTPFANPLVVEVRDAFNNVISGTSVSYTVNPLNGASGTGTTANPAVTGANGRAQLNLTANAIKGSYTVTATVNALTPATFNLTNNGPVFSSNPAPENIIDMGITVFGTTLNYSLVISNAGSGTLNVGAVSGLDTTFQATPSAAFNLTAGQIQVVNLQCTPPGVALYSTSITYTSNDSDRPTATYTLRCRGIAPREANFFEMITPARLYDSRTNVLNTAPQGKDGPISTGQVRVIQAGGLVSIPVTATGILANITVANAQGGGNLKAFPANLNDIDIASVNWYTNPLPGARVVANFAVIPLDSNGAFKIKAQGTTEFIIDVTGYLVNIPTGAGVFKVLPSGVNPRLYDSRPVSSQNTALLGKGTGAVNIGATPRTIKVAGAGTLQNIPATATAVVINVTAANTKKGGYFTLYPATGAVPFVSSVNWNDYTQAGTNIPRDVGNMAIVPLSANGEFSVITGGVPGSGANLIVDVIGFIDEAPGATSGFQLPVSPQLRLYDSRVGQPNYAGSAQKGVLPAQNTRQIKGAGVVSVPANAQAVLVRVVTVDVSGGGYLALYPQEPYPGNSTVNTNAPNQQMGNLAVVPLDANGNFLVRNGSGGSSMGFVIDIVAYIV